MCYFLWHGDTSLKYNNKKKEIKLKLKIIKAASRDRDR